MFDPRKIPFWFHPWGWFFLLVLSNAALSLGDLPLAAKIGIGAAGIILPVGILAAGPLGKREGMPLPFLEEWTPSIPRGVWVLLGVLILFTRLYRLKAVLPSGDEALVGLYGMRLAEHWNWDFFYTVSQHTPLLIWVTAALLRWVHPPFPYLLALPAVLSMALVPLAYWALRAFSSRSFSFLGALLFSFHLWCLYSGRWSSQGVLVVPWELLCLGLAGYFLGERDPRRKGRYAALLGMASGLCYLTFPSWPFVLLLLGFILWQGVWKGPGDRIRPFITIGSAFLVVFLPFLWVAWQQGFGVQTRLISALDQWIPLSRRWEVASSYITSFFWGAGRGVQVYDADNWERWNPLWASVFFCGLAALIHHRSQKWVWVLGAALFLSLAPAFLSTYVEMFRIIHVLPFLLAVTAVGLAVLLGELPPGRRWMALGAFLVLSAAWDLHRVFQKPGNPFASPDLSYGSNVAQETAKAYGLLRDEGTREGPGSIFTEFIPQWEDPALLVKTYSFNAAENPRLDPSRARWAAVLLNKHYVPFLSRRFPGAQWHWLGEGSSRGSDQVLGIIPVNAGNRRTLDLWREVHAYFRKGTEDLNNISGPSTYQKAMEGLSQPPAALARDRFLIACYWERRAEAYYRNGFQDHYDDMVSALGRAIDQGLPAAHLSFKLGSLYLRKGRFGEARRVYEEALRMEPGNGEILNALRILREREGKKGTLP